MTNKILFPILVSSLFVLLQFNPNDVFAQTNGIDSNCLVHHYPFNNNLNDSTKNNNHLTNFGATKTTGRNGVANTAYNFTNKQYLTGGIDSLPSGPNERTVILWLYLDGTPDSDVPICWGNNSPAGSYGIAIGDNLDYPGQKAMRHFAWGKNHDHGFLINYPIGDWFHLALTYDGDTAKTYLNGTLVTSAKRSWDTKKRFFYIGQNIDGANNDFFEGKIDDIKIYKCAASATEVENDYKGKVNVVQTKTSDISIYPNPAKSVISFNIDGFLSDVVARVLDYQGRELLQPSVMNENKIDVNSLPSGIYFLKLQSKDQVIIKKWVKN